ncbi:protein TIC 20-II, chloroplastic [Mangifera indica]|uniref:protein TIC 20-II, chloroplastic n=1 Tax=Mangifera indica TaxID=29780 RepID=UPI001CF9FE1F|nr:protein TIC 20-II, chloroplastic [Mangifera indica]
MASLPLSLSLHHSPKPFISNFNPRLSTAKIFLSPKLTPTHRPKSIRTVKMSYKNNSPSSFTTPAPERLISAVAYTLPFFNSLQYGRYLFMQYPQLGLLFDPFLPLLGLYRAVPYASFVAFFALYLGVVRNPSFSRYVRFNAMQAVTLDVLLVVPLLLTRIFNPGRAGIGFKLMVWGHNAVFVFSCFCFVYGLICSMLGKTPYLPFVAGAAGRQL